VCVVKSYRYAQRADLVDLPLTTGLWRQLTACLPGSGRRLQRRDAVRRYSVSFREQVLHQKSLDCEDTSVCSAVRTTAHSDADVSKFNILKLIFQRS